MARHYSLTVGEILINLQPHFIEKETMVGTTISHYKVVEKLGEGGMGVVYKAQDLKLDRFVAVKFLLSAGEKTEEQKQRFIHEAKAASSLDHQHIGTIHEIGETEDGDLFIVMPFYEGETLQSLLKRGTLPFDDIRNYALQISKGLSKAHAKGIVHRDLKPANILITKDGVVKIIDFGLAKLSSASKLTVAGTSLGTPGYMSPEQSIGEELDQRTDIWSFGVILYEMVAGRHPFPGEYDAVILYKIVNEKHEPANLMREGIPPDIQNVLDKALEKDKQNRFQSIDEVSQLLSGGAPPPPPVSAQPASTSVTTNSKPRLLWAGIGAGIVSVLIISIYFLLTRDSGSSLSSPTLTVLPLVNSADRGREYLSAGITREVISLLKERKPLNITSANTIFARKDENQTINDLRTLFGSDYILRGTFSQSGTTILIACSLFSTQSQSPVWSNTFESSPEQLVSLTSKIVDEVSGFLHVDQNFTKSHTTFPAPEAYDAYLKGLYHQSKELWSEQKLAIAYFREAVRADSTFSRALVSAAHSQVEAFENGWSTDSGLIQSAGTYCSLAMRLDSLNANAYAVQGTIESNKGNDAEGIRLWQKAAALDPNNALAVTQLAFHYLFYFNEPAKGTLFLEKLRNVDPSDWLITSNVGIGYAQLKNYPEATYWLRRALTLNPKNGLSWNNLGYIYERGEAYDSAISCYKKALVLSPGNFTMYENTISLLLFQRQYASAESVATEARTFLPNHHELLYLAGVLRQQSDRQSEAVTAWKEGMTLLRARRLNGQPTPVWDTDESLFLARLGRREESISKLSKALNADSSDSEVIIKAARIYSVLGIKDRVLYYFQRARQMNPEYDLSYLRTAVDFEFFRNDGDLQALARLSN